MSLKRQLKLTLFVLLAAIGFVAAFLLAHLPHGPEHWSADLRTAWLSDWPATQHPQIVLIEVTDTTLQDYRYVSPIDRKLLADLVQAVDDAGAKTIGFDVVLDRPTEIDSDGVLLDRLRDARARVVLGVIDDRTLISEAARKFQAKALVLTKRPTGHLYFHGHHSPVVISDNVVRQVAETTGQLKSFAEVLTEDETSYRLSGSSRISWLLTPRDKTETFLTLPAESVLGRAGVNLPLDTLLRDKIVLIGGNFLDRDQHLTPLSVWSDQRYSGLFIHAQIVAQILDRRVLRDVPWPFALIIVALAFVIGLQIGGSAWSEHYHPWIEIVSVAALILLTLVAFLAARVIFPFVPVLLGWGAGVTAGHYRKTHIHAGHLQN